jgi:uncharacterized protein (DUF849 family)
VAAGAIQRAGLVLFLKPDMASLSTGSVNFPTIVYENHTTLVVDLATKMRDFGIRPEIEIFDLSHLHGARRLVEQGLMDEQPHVQFVLGVRTPCRPRSTSSTFSSTKSDACSEATWTAAGSGGTRRR